MKNLIYIIGTILLIGACDTREDYFTQTVPGPQLFIKKGDEKVKKVTQEVKLGYDSIYFDYVVTNLDEEEYQIKQHWDKGVRCVLVDSVHKKFRIVTEKTGVGTAYVMCEDQLGQTSMVTVNLDIFKNKPPKAKYETEKLGDGWIKIDASKSFDTDSAFGGHIIQYEYRIHDYNQKTHLDYLKYNFVESGDYNVKVRVCDSDSTWSDWNLKTVSL